MNENCIFINELNQWIKEHKDVEIEGALIAFRRKNDNLTGSTSLCRNDVGVTLRLLEEAKIQRLILNKGLEKYVNSEDI